MRVAQRFDRTDSADDINTVAAAEQILRKAHVRLIRHRKTYLYSGVLMLGESRVDDRKCKTACTDGINKYYNSVFVLSQGSVARVAGLVLHEALHVFLKQMQRHRDFWKADHRTANAAADYVVNAIIKQIEQEDREALASAKTPGDPVVILPDGGLYDPMFINWSFRQVYLYLKKGQPEQPQDEQDEQDEPQDGDNEPDDGEQDEQQDGDDEGDKDGDNEPDDGEQDEQDGDDGEQDGDDGEQDGDDGEQDDGSVTVDGKKFSLDTLDEHDASDIKDLTDEQIKEIIEQIDQGIQQAGLLAGLHGIKLPRAVQEMFEPEVKWEDVVQDFYVSHTRGNTDYTFSKFNRRRLIDDIYRPSTYKERLGRVVLAIDTSASITQQEINRVTALIVMLCEQCPPEELTVLWWDTAVHGRQDFTESDFANLRSALKPCGFGGTRVSCVSEFMQAEHIDADCVIVFTDGYVEHDIQWSVSAPTLWVVKGNEQFVPPVGTLVKFN